MFSFISLHWRGEPLVSYEAIVNLIGSTTTQKGLKVKAKLDTREYKKGRKVSDKEMARLHIEYHRVHPQWNYTIKPSNPKKSAHNTSIT